MKTRTTAYALWLLGLLGLCGLHRVYVGRGGTAVVWLLTFGLFGVGQLADLFSIGRMIDERNGLGQAPLAVHTVQNVLVKAAAPPPPAPDLLRPRREANRIRCQYCSASGESTATTCGECGAPLVLNKEVQARGTC